MQDKELLMTEQEYCDLKDLQLARQILHIARDMNCYDMPINEYRDDLIKAARKITDHLEPIVSENVD